MNCAGWNWPRAEEGRGKGVPSLIVGTLRAARDGYESGIIAAPHPCPHSPIILFIGFVIVSLLTLTTRIRDHIRHLQLREGVFTVSLLTISSYRSFICSPVSSHSIDSPSLGACRAVFYTQFQFEEYDSPVCDEWSAKSMTGEAIHHVWS
ncbi:hypothetical protein PRIPAC_75594, partial [Pristionchus pacificus]|uniref:Uncharacterized protein n=1 Tax=Pristionchus pacificus TaxID=54126 RepID=A0A2A6CGL6_PRIPA